MVRKQKLEILICCLILLVVAAVTDYKVQKDKATVITKQGVGKGETELEFIVRTDEMETELSYLLEVGEEPLTQTEAQEYFERAQKEIAETIFSEGDSCDAVYRRLNLKKKYANNTVRATWDFDRYDVIDYDGSLMTDVLTEDGVVVEVSAYLRIQEYKYVYSFPIRVYPMELEGNEKLLADIASYIARQDGEKEIHLPEVINGISLSWKKKQSFVFWKVLLLELFLGVILVIGLKQKKKQSKQRLEAELSYDYPEIVGKFVVLLGAGLSPKHVWYNISAGYLDERQKRHIKKRPVYEQMVQTYYELQDGENERTAYEKFANRVGILCYYRLVQLLIQCNEKGVQGVDQNLQKESQMAFEQRKRDAKKKGEELSTKLVFPLILMLGIILLIILVPAMIHFIR